MKPLIGVTSCNIADSERPNLPHFLAQRHSYTEAIELAGGIPVIIPIMRDMTVARGLFERLDGLLVAGGDDIGPARYMEDNRYATHIDAARDEFELLLLEWATDSGLPVLGICRGMQLMNVSRGGTLYQDIAQERPKSDAHDGFADHNQLVHTLDVVEGSRLSRILTSQSIQTNSRHHQAVRNVGRGLVANAYAEDNVIEGVESLDGPLFLGVQSHPESLVHTVQTEWRALFEELTGQASAFAESKSWHSSYLSASPV